jgi:hypothetical protein
MHAVDTEKGKPQVVKSEKEVLDIASNIIRENGLEDYADVIKRGALLANVSLQLVPSTNMVTSVNLLITNRDHL